MDQLSSVFCSLPSFSIQFPLICSLRISNFVPVVFVVHSKFLTVDLGDFLFSELSLVFWLSIL